MFALPIRLNWFSQIWGTFSVLMHINCVARMFCIDFLCAILWNKRGYVPRHNPAFSSSTSRVKIHQVKSLSCDKSHANFAYDFCANLSFKAVELTATLHVMHMMLIDAVEMNKS